MSKAAPTEPPPTAWSSTQAYVLAVFCLLLGVTLGYLFRGSASPGASRTASVSADSALQSAIQPNASEQRNMLERAAAPLRDALKQNPNDFDRLAQLGNLYYDGKQFPEAIKYYERALEIRPDNPDVRTDLGTAYWYTGDADTAIVELQKSLKIRPDHAGTLFNLGVVKWQGKMDPAGAAKAWEQLLKRNPDYPQRRQVEEFIEKAKQHAKG